MKSSLVVRAAYAHEEDDSYAFFVEALNILKQKGFDTALVGGGAQLVNTCLSQGLVDEIYINVYPLVSKGATFAMSENQANLELIDVNKLTEQRHRTIALQSKAVKRKIGEGTL